MPRPPNIREVLDALDWVRKQMMYRGSPDFIRQRELEARVGRLATRLLRGGRARSHDVKPQSHQ